MVSGPDLEALVAGVQRLSEFSHPDDPVYQDMIATSVAMVETYLEGQPGDCSDDPALLALRAYQIGTELAALQFD